MIRSLISIVLCVVLVPIGGVARANPKLSEISKCEANLSLANPNEHLSYSYPARIGVFSALPNNAREYQAVYGKPDAYTKPVQEHFSTANKLVDQASAGEHVERSSSGQSFRAFVERSRSNVIVVIGHNDKGTFHFLDGSTESVLDMNARCHKANKFCIFITCNSGTLLKGQSPCSKLACKITAESSARLLKRIARRVAEASSAKSKISVQQIQAAMEEEAAAFGGGIGIRLVVAAGAVVGVVIVIYFLTEDEKKKRSRQIELDLKELRDELDSKEGTVRPSSQR